MTPSACLTVTGSWLERSLEATALAQFPLEALHDPFLGQGQRRGLQLLGKRPELVTGRLGQTQLQHLRTAEAPGLLIGRHRLISGRQRREVGLKFDIWCRCGLLRASGAVTTEGQAGFRASEGHSPTIAGPGGGLTR